MRFNCCHVSLAFVLKFLNFLQAFVGVSILLYSIWMLNQWNHQQIPQPPFPHPPYISLRGSLGVDLNSLDLPAPWFIYAFMGAGVLVCCVTFLGCIAAELINGCCLCFYTLLITVLLLLEAVLVGFIAIDHLWEEHLPIDPTGQLDSLKSFIEDNMDICKWVGIAVLAIQASSLLMALILRASVSSRGDDSAYEDEYDSRVPLMSPKSGQASSSIKVDNRINHSDIWSSRMREKYGFTNSEKMTYQQP